MDAYVLTNAKSITNAGEPLIKISIKKPSPGVKEVCLKVLTCGICHTDLDIAEGRLPTSKLPIVLGHQVIGIVDDIGEKVAGFSVGDRVGIGWFANACGTCEFCRQGKQNLCAHFKATGKDISGGYAEYMIAHEKSIFHIPECFSNEEASPLLCAGAIGYRSLKLSGIQNHQLLGFMGFGASAHIVVQLTRFLFPKTEIYAFSRNSDQRQLALDLGATWAGNVGQKPPKKLHAVIDTTPAWKPMLESLTHIRPGGRLIINAIRKSESDKIQLENICYEDHLWLEKEIKSVANITTLDIQEFLKVAEKIPIRPTVTIYPFNQLNQALRDVKLKSTTGAAVIQVASKHE